VRRFLSVGVLVLAGLALSSCGRAQSDAYVPSKNCTLSTTNTDYAGCNFSGRDLRGLDFQSDNLSHANLSHADLDGANLQGARTNAALTTGAITNSSTACVNAVFGPCTERGLRGPGRSQGGT
jgi:uncharacterized protein YjbI with pentapeptide repeats